MLDTTVTNTQIKAYFRPLENLAIMSCWKRLCGASVSATWDNAHRTEWKTIWDTWLSFNGAFQWSIRQTRKHIQCHVSFLSIIQIITLHHSSVSLCNNFSAVLPFRLNIQILNSLVLRFSEEKTRIDRIALEFCCCTNEQTASQIHIGRIS